MTHRRTVGACRLVVGALRTAGVVFATAVVVSGCGAPAPADPPQAPPVGAAVAEPRALAPPVSPATSESSRGAVGSTQAAGGTGTSTTGGGEASREPLATAQRAPEDPPAPRTREVVLPAGTTLRVKLASDVASDSSRVEDVVRGTLEAPIAIGGEVVVPPGAAVRGTVTAVQRAGKVRGRASIALRFDRLSAHGEDHELRTDPIRRQAPATKKDDAAKIGVGAGFGAAIGAIAGGGKGAAIGSAVGAGAGTGTVMATRGAEVRLEAGSVVTTKMREPIKMVVGR